MKYTLAPIPWGGGKRMGAYCFPVIVQTSIVSWLSCSVHVFDVFPFCITLWRSHDGWSQAFLGWFTLGRSLLVPLTLSVDPIPHEL